MPPFVPTTHTVPEPGPGVQLGGSRLPRLKPSCLGRRLKETSNQIKGCWGWGGEKGQDGAPAPLGMEMRTLSRSGPQGRPCQALIWPAPSRRSLFDVGVGECRAHPVSPTRILSASSAF